MSRIKATLDELSDQEAALVTYMMGGYPTLEQSNDVAEALVDGGADIIEIGIPFSDPIADGPIIQSASKQALENGMTLRRALRLCRTIQEKYSLPIVLMGYLNPIHQMGYERFFDEAKASNVDGIIVPDLPLEESYDFRAIARMRGIDVILLAAPSTSPTRLGLIASRTSGFLYLVSVYGVTGPRREIPNCTLQFIKKAVRTVSRQVPLSVGFGISRPEQVKTIAITGAKGVVVGSSLVNELLRSATCSKEVLSRLRIRTRQLKRATVLPQ